MVLRVCEASQNLYQSGNKIARFYSGIITNETTGNITNLAIKKYFCEIQRDNDLPDE